MGVEDAQRMNAIDASAELRILALPALSLLLAILPYLDAFADSCQRA